MATVPAKSPNDRVLPNPANPLPDRLIRQNTLAIATHYELGCAAPGAVDKAMDVLKKTDCAIALRDRASLRTHDPRVRGCLRVSLEDTRLPSLWKRQHHERPQSVH